MFKPPLPFESIMCLPWFRCSHCSGQCFPNTGGCLAHNAKWKASSAHTGEVIWFNFCLWNVFPSVHVINHLWNSRGNMSCMPLSYLKFLNSFICLFLIDVSRLSFVPYSFSKNTGEIADIELRNFLFHLYIKSASLWFKWLTTGSLAKFTDWHCLLQNQSFPSTGPNCVPDTTWIFVINAEKTSSKQLMKNNILQDSMLQSITYGCILWEFQSLQPIFCWVNFTI